MFISLLKVSRMAKVGYQNISLRELYQFQYVCGGWADLVGQQRSFKVKMAAKSEIGYFGVMEEFLYKRLQFFLQYSIQLYN